MFFKSLAEIVRDLDQSLGVSWEALAALVVSAIALAVAAKTYWLKTGVHLRGSFSMASSRDCDDWYISNVILENLKDRAVTIFAVYLRVGHGHYLQIEDFEDAPLLLRPFEVFQKEYGPVQFYGVNSLRMDLNDLLKDQKIRKRMVLSTSEGRYTIPTSIRKWNPVGDFFKNQLTAIVHPVRLPLKGNYVGGNIRYVVEFLKENGQEEVVKLHPRDFEVMAFRNFRLTVDSLSSKEKLEAYLNIQVDEGKLVCKSFVVHDTNLWKERIAEYYAEQTIVARAHGFFVYHILGRLVTKYENRRLKKMNNGSGHISDPQGTSTEVTPSRLGIFGRLKSAVIRFKRSSIGRLIDAVDPSRIAKNEIPSFSVKACYENIRNYSISAGLIGIIHEFFPKATLIGQGLMVIVFGVAAVLAGYNFFQSYRLGELLFTPAEDSVRDQHWLKKASLVIFSICASSVVAYSVFAFFLMAIAKALK